MKIPLNCALKFNLKLHSSKNRTKNLNIVLWFLFKLSIASKSENEYPQRFLLYSLMKDSKYCETNSDQNALRGNWSSRFRAMTDKINQNSLLSFMAEKQSINSCFYEPAT